MIGLREKIKAELISLLDQATNMLENLNKTRQSDSLSDYQAWYSRSLAVVRQLLPERLNEFTMLYEGKRKNARKGEVLAPDYGIGDYLLGMRVRQGIPPRDTFDHESVVLMKFKQQFEILSSGISRLNDILSNIEGILQAELFDSELDAARELLKKGHLRAGGTVGGVVLERHLSIVARNHNVKLKKKDPTLNDLNEALKKAGTVDVPTWRGIQRLGDILNLCAHKKDREPIVEEVRELIDGVDYLTKTLL